MNLSRILVLAVVVAGLCLPGAVQADVVKHDVYILGIHLGNADGVLFGLTNSYDTSKKAHPKALPLLKRQWVWSIDLAKKLGLPTDQLEALDKDMDKLEFRDMRSRLQGILTRYRSLLAGNIAPKADDIFELSLDFTMVGGILTLAKNVRPAEVQGWRDKAASRSEKLAPNIRANKLEATVSLASEYTKRIRAGESLGDLDKFSDTVLKKWQDDFLEAPPFGDSTTLAAAQGAARDLDGAKPYLRRQEVFRRLQGHAVHPGDDQAGQGHHRGRQDEPGHLRPAHRPEPQAPDV